MNITAIKQQIKNPARVSVFVDGKYAFSLTLDQLLEFKLKKGQELDEPDIKQYKKLSDEGKQKARALEWLMMRPHSAKEFHDYAFRKKIEKDVAAAWADEFVTKKYIDDEQFARWFAENRLRKHKSQRAVVAELRSKGINQELAGRVVAELSGDDTQALKNLVAKLRTRTRYKDEQKLKAYLLGKGFCYDDIRSALVDQA